MSTAPLFFLDASQTADLIASSSRQVLDAIIVVCALVLNPRASSRRRQQGQAAASLRDVEASISLQRVDSADSSTAEHSDRKVVDY